MATIKKYKVCRRLGAAIYEKCQTQKFTLSEAKRARKRRRRPTDYGLQLVEKQKVRFMYGVSEKQFKNYVLKALDTARPADSLFELLERRLDNITYRCGLAPTRRMARQMVSHGHITVDGKRITVPSAHTRTGKKIAVRDASKKKQLFVEIDTRLKSYKAPSWIKFDGKALSGEVVGTPTEPDPILNFQTVIEFYSR